MKPSIPPGSEGLAILLATAVLAGCTGPPGQVPVSQRLVDDFEAAMVTGSPPAGADLPAPTEWRFDGPPPQPPPEEHAATRGWEAVRGVAGLAVEDGVLRGETTDGSPILRLRRTAGWPRASASRARSPRSTT